MKKILISIMLLSSISSFANISKNCKSQMDDLIVDHQEFEHRVPSHIEKNELTEEEVEIIRTSQSRVVEMVALTCAGLRKIELQRSLPGALGLISVEKANKEAKIAHDDAVEYYHKNK